MTDCACGNPINRVGVSSCSECIQLNRAISFGDIRTPSEARDFREGYKDGFMFITRSSEEKSPAYNLGVRMGAIDDMCGNNPW